MDNGDHVNQGPSQFYEGDVAAPNIPAAEPLPPAPDVGQQQDQPQMPSRQEQPAPPKQYKFGSGMLPAIAELGKAFINPPSDQAVQMTNGMYRPANRLDAFEGFLGDFLNSFATGLRESGHGPGSFGRGFGAAVTAPYERSVQLQQLQQQQGLSQSEQARVFNAADRPAQIIYSKTMDGLNKWAAEEQKTGYLDFGADPQQARASFEAEYQRRVDAANSELLKRTESKIGVNAPGSTPPAATGNTTGAGATPSGFPKQQTPAAPPARGKTSTPPKPTQSRAFESLINADPVLQKATAALSNVKQPAEIKREIEISKSLTPSQKSILKGFYGIK